MIPLKAVYKNIQSMRNPIWFLRFVRCINYCENFQIILQKKKVRIIDWRRQNLKKIKNYIAFLSEIVSICGLKEKRSVSLTRRQIFA